MSAARRRLVRRCAELCFRTPICGRIGPRSHVVVVASAGYPASPRTGDPITGLDAAAEVPGVVVLHAGTTLDAEGALVSAGGRVLDVVAVAPSLAEARRAAYDAVAVIELDGSHHRTDIALRAERGDLEMGGAR